MDLKKLDPMARKMRNHVDAFYKALEENDGFSARSHINEIMKYADYLSNDIESTVIKNENTKGVNDIYAGGVPVMKTKEGRQSVHQSTSNVLPGTIRTNSYGNMKRRLSNRNV